MTQAQVQTPVIVAGLVTSMTSVAAAADETQETATDTASVTVTADAAAAAEMTAKKQNQRYPQMTC
jgi:hypothetical protein